MIRRDEFLTGDRAREAIKALLIMRQKERPRRSRRSLEEILRIAEIARFAFKRKFEIVTWGEDERVLKMKSS